MGGVRDKIDMNDTAGAALGCAKCGAIVKSSETHTCKGEASNGDKQNASDGPVSQGRDSTA
jgi:hypothetical protein